jgi:hypothetical protein
LALPAVEHTGLDLVLVAKVRDRHLVLQVPPENGGLLLSRELPAVLPLSHETPPLVSVYQIPLQSRSSWGSTKLVDVFPDGPAFNIQEMILRARYREGVTRPALLQPGQVYQLQIRLSPSAHVFLPGHRIRLDITSSNFPRYERNLNTGGDSSTETAWQVATSTVHHSDGRASVLLLPVSLARSDSSISPVASAGGIQQ